MGAAVDAAAMINVRDGAYRHSVTDLGDNSVHDEFRVERVYQSKTSRIGMFGFGWCTELEAKLEERARQAKSLYDCRLGYEIRYRRDPDRPGDWVADNATQERLIHARGRLIRPKARGGFETYDENTGRLVGITDRAGRVLEVRHDAQGRLLEITDAAKRHRIQFDYSQSQRVSRVSFGREDVSYAFTEDDLIESRSRRRRRVYAYSYDEFHNLESVRRDGIVTEQMTYDRDTDRVLSVRNGPCESRVSYRADELHLSAEANKICNGLARTRKTFDFWFNENGNRETILEKMRVDLAGSRRPARFGSGQEVR